MKKISLLSLFVFIGLSANANMLINGNFSASSFTGWSAGTGTALVSKGLVSGSEQCAQLLGSTATLTQTVSNVGAEFNFDFYFACPNPVTYGSPRALQLLFNGSQFNMIVNAAGSIQFYNGSWQTVGTVGAIAWSTDANSNGTLTDVGDVINAYHLKIVMRNWAVAGSNYDVYLSAPNNPTLNLLASNLTYFQAAPSELTTIGFSTINGPIKAPETYLVDECSLTVPGRVQFQQTNFTTLVKETNQTSDTIYVSLSTPPTQDVTVNITEKNSAYLTLFSTQLVFTSANYDIPQKLIVTAIDDTVDQKGLYTALLSFQTQSADAVYNANVIPDIIVKITDNESVFQYPSFSGIYPHIATTNSDNECGMGAVVPWQGDLWYITYSDHYPKGSDDKLYQLSPEMTVVTRPESVGGTPANRMIHKESNQLIIGSHFVDANKNVRTISPTIMQGRMTANARHLTDPANRVYFVTMEEGIYDVNVSDLSFTTLHPDVNTPGTTRMVPGAHMKGAYVGQNRLMIANNGYEGTFPNADGGVLSEWKGAADGDPMFSTSWHTVDLNKYTEITSKGGIYGANSQTDPIWSLGWDKKSVLLSVCDNGGQWTRYRLPKASYSHDANHGWYTEWPRIRDIGFDNDTYLMHMHGMFYRFPASFSNTKTAGIRPFSSFLKMVVDYADWNGKIALACDDATKFANGICPRDQSNITFIKRDSLENYAGQPYGFGGVWINETVNADVPSEPMLINGFQNRIIHIAQNTGKNVNFKLQADIMGNNNWTDLATVEVPSTGYTNYILPKSLNAQWLRIVSDTKVTSASAYFYMSNPVRTPETDLTKSVPTIQQRTGLNSGVIRPMADKTMKLEYAADIIDDAGVKTTAYYQLDGDLNFVQVSNPTAETTLRGTYAPSKDFSIDNASVLITATINKQQYRLPFGDAEFSNPTVSGNIRGIREVVTERSLINVHGTIYELPRDDAGSGGFPKIRPITTHNKQIFDYCSWRGLLVMSGNFNAATADSHYKKTADGKAGLWLGSVDDLFKMGTPKGIGSTWKDAPVTANTPSLPYLMQGYANKSVVLSHNSAQAVIFNLDVDYLAGGTYVTAFKVTVQPGETKLFQFPEGFNAQWVRTAVNVSCTATATFYYNTEPIVNTKVHVPSASNIVVFPNPVKDMLNIQGLKSPSKVDVYTLQGVKVMSAIVSNKLDVSNLRPGAYLLHTGSYRQTLIVKK